MISRARWGRMAPLVLAAGFSLAMTLPVHAQAPPADGNPDAAAEEADAPEDTPDINDLELDWSQLNVDAGTLLPKTPNARPGPQAGTEMSWASKEKPNGGSDLSVKRPLLPFWDTRIGADMSVTRPPSALTGSELLSEKLANGGSAPQSSATAWAAMTGPGVGSIWDKTAIEARVDPAQDSSKLGTSLSKSLALSDQYSLTLQNGYNVIQPGMMPLPGIPARPPRNYATEQSATLSIADTGTSFIAGQTLSSADDKWLRRIGAEQKLFGGVSVTGSIGETPLGTTSKSLTAGFKHSW